MTQNIPSGFYAYSSQPPIIGETIRTAIESINSSSVASIRGWDKLKIGGKLVINEICKEIIDASIFCADLTTLNPNVMFELGYAIGINKRIWLTIDETFSASADDFRKLRILTTIGYTTYVNSHQLATSFYNDHPYSDLSDTLFTNVIEPQLISVRDPNLFYMKSRHNTEASRSITRRIDESSLPKIIDDPSESGVQTLAWYGEQIYSALGVVCHLTNPGREGAQLHNSKYALVAGMAFGMEKPLLMLSEGDFLAPIDYRELLRQYQTATEATTSINRWLQPLENDWHEQKASKVTYASTVRLANELKSLQLGEYIAENESEGLIDRYFVETKHYDEVIEGNVTIFVGRKGTGKSANLIKAAARLKEDKRNLVCVIKPESYELQSVVRLLATYRDADIKGYAIQSLWKFLIYTEIANQAAKQIEERNILNVPLTDLSELKLIELLDRSDGLLREDFSIRLERCVADLTKYVDEGKQNETVAKTRFAISEILHGNILSEVRKVLGEVLNKKQRVAILIDNLDKAWDGPLSNL